MPDQELAADLDRLRRTAGFTLRDLVKTSGVPRSTLSDALSGRRAPKLDTVVAIARACGADVDSWRRRWAVGGVVRSDGRAAGEFSAAALAEYSDLPGLPTDQEGSVGSAAGLRRLGVGGAWLIDGAAAVGKPALQMTASETLGTGASRLGLAETGAHRHRALELARRVGDNSAAPVEFLVSSSCPEHLLAEALALAEQVRDTARLACDHGVGGDAITVIALVEFRVR